MRIFKSKTLDSDNSRDLMKASKMLRLHKKNNEEIKFFYYVVKYELNRRGVNV